MRHKHKCDHCGHEWECWLEAVEREASICDVTKAAKHNGQGPFCDLCRNLKMAQAHASSRAALHCTDGMAWWLITRALHAVRTGEIRTRKMARGTKNLPGGKPAGIPRPKGHEKVHRKALLKRGS